MSDDSHEYDEDALEFIEDERVRIAALHATCPKEIWLQIDPEAEQFDGWDAQTWCSDKINETDVRYVLAASRDAEIAGLMDDAARYHFLRKFLSSKDLPILTGRGERNAPDEQYAIDCVVDVAIARARKP